MFTHSSRWLHALALAALAIAAGAPVAAPAQDHHGIPVAFGAGWASGSMSAGGGRASSNGLTVHGALGPLEAEFQTFSIPNPVAAENFRSVYLTIGPRLHIGEQAFLRPEVGLQFRSWSGSAQVTSNDLGPAVGIIAGFEAPLSGGWRIIPQVVARWALIEPEGNVSTRALGLRLEFRKRHPAPPAGGSASAR